MKQRKSYKEATGYKEIKPNTKLNKLLFLEEITPHGREKKRLRVKCLCDCGTEIICGKTQFLTGHTKSCGCLQRAAAKSAGESRRMGYGESTFKRLHYSYKWGAEKRDFNFELTIDEVKKLSQQNCYFCGAPPKTIFKVKGFYGFIYYNGIDRLDNNIGYTKENSVTCCETCNRAKRCMSEEEFKNWVSRVYHHFVVSNNSDKPLQLSCQPAHS